MTEGGKPAELKDLDKRLRAARSHQKGSAGGGSGTDDQAGQQGGVGVAVRIGVDLVAALVVGVAIGILLDYWLDTKPWFLVLFFVLGAAAGFLNVFRSVAGYGLAAGYRKTEKGSVEEDAAKDGLKDKK